MFDSTVKIGIGDKVKIAGEDGLYSVQYIARVSGEDMARLLGKNGWYSMNQLCLEWKRESYIEHKPIRIFKSASGKIVKQIV